MKLKSFRLFSNVIICFMLIGVTIYLGASGYSYVFSYQNDEIIYNGNKESPNLSVMFNVYWGTEYIDGILDVLKENGVKTTFFVGGQWAEKEPEMLNKIISEGHEIGNHGFFHKEHEYLSLEQNRDEINACHQLIKVTTGVNMSLFAPPSGSFNKSTITASKDLGYKVIMWSKDTIDWRDKDADLIFKRATNNIKGGDLVLMHPTEDTLKALPLILKYYKINNLNPTTVSNCLK